MPAAGLLALDRDARRVLQVPSRNRQNPRRHRRRKERRLPRVGRRLQNRVEVVGEAHVEHLVGLVEDQHLQRVEAQRVAPQVIERASRRRDDDVGAAFEGADLLVHRRAAVERQDGQPDALGVLVDRLGHLHRQLAGRDEHEAAGLARAGWPSPIRCSIGSANAAVLPVPVPAWPSRSRPFEKQRDRFALNRRRFLVSERGDAVGQLALQSEGRETGGKNGSAHLVIISSPS